MISSVSEFWTRPTRRLVRPRCESGQGVLLGTSRVPVGEEWAGYQTRRVCPCGAPRPEPEQRLLRASSQGVIHEPRLSGIMTTRPPVQVMAAPRRRLRKAPRSSPSWASSSGVARRPLPGAGLQPLRGGNRRPPASRARAGGRRPPGVHPARPEVPRRAARPAVQPGPRRAAERFQQFLRSDFARKTGAVEALSSAFGELDLLRSRPPLGLDLWKDISGDALLFAGYGPSRAGRAVAVHRDVPPELLEGARRGQRARRRRARRPLRRSGTGSRRPA